MGKKIRIIPVDNNYLENLRWNNLSPNSKRREEREYDYKIRRENACVKYGCFSVCIAMLIGFCMLF